MSASSVSATGVAGRYATALFDLAREQDVLDPVERDLRAIAELIGESPELDRALKSPLVTTSAKTGIARALGEKVGFHATTVRFLGVVGRQGRLEVLHDIVAAFHALVAEHRGEIAVEVVSATPLAADQEEAVRSLAAEALGRNVDLKLEVDPELLGGLVLRVGSRMIDASVKTKLRHLELAMRGAG